MKHELPPLPYEKNALEPHISARTLEYHYGKHHQKYVDTLNSLIIGTKFEDRSLEEIIDLAGDGPLFNNAAQVWNHTFYWLCLSPQGGGEPRGQLAEAIATSFGSYDGLKKEFTAQATSLFGSGWVWLVKDSENTLSIQATKDGANPLASGRIALMTCDMWEHAYYLDYQNDKARYLAAFWQLVNWDFVGGKL